MKNRYKQPPRAPPIIGAKIGIQKKYAELSPSSPINASVPNANDANKRGPRSRAGFIAPLNLNFACFYYDFIYPPWFPKARPTAVAQSPIKSGFMGFGWRFLLSIIASIKMRRIRVPTIWSKNISPLKQLITSFYSNLTVDNLYFSVGQVANKQIKFWFSISS